MKKLAGVAMAAMLLAVAAAPAFTAEGQTQPGKAARAEKAAKGARTEKAGKAGKTSTALDGSRWKVTVTPNPAAAAKGEKVFEDEFVFAAGKVTMTACVPYGFTASDYKATKAGEGWSFEATQTSPTAGSSEWKAKMNGDSVKGTLTWKKGPNDVFHYTVEGKKVGG